MDIYEPRNEVKELINKFDGTKTNLSVMDNEKLGYTYCLHTPRTEQIHLFALNTAA